MASNRSGVRFLAKLIVAAALSELSQPVVSTAQERVKFPVGVGTKTLGTGLIWLATKKGFFDEFALDVQPVLLRGTPVAVQALVGESLYLTMGSADAMASAAVGGVGLVSVAGVQSLASGTTTALTRIFKKTVSTIPRITNSWPWAVATSIWRR